MSDIAERIKRGRHETGWSIRQLAKEVNASPQTISKIESGKTASPRAILLARISQALHLDLSYLLYGAEIEIQISESGKAIEISLPFVVTLDYLSKQRLARRLAMEFELIREEAKE